MNRTGAPGLSRKQSGPQGLGFDSSALLHLPRFARAWGRPGNGVSRAADCAAPHRDSSALLQLLEGASSSGKTAVSKAADRGSIPRALAMVGVAQWQSGRA